MDVRLPNGKLLRGVPEGTPKDVIMQKAIASGIASEADFGIKTPNSNAQADLPASMANNGANDVPVIAEIEARPETNRGSVIDEVVEPTLAVAGGAAGSILGGIGGAAMQTPFFKAIRGITGQEPKNIDDAVGLLKRTQEFFRNDPDTERGKRGLLAVQGVFEDIEGIGNYLGAGAAGLSSLITNPTGGIDAAKQAAASVREGGLGEYMGEGTLRATNSPTAATAAKLTPSIVETLLGGGVAARAANQTQKLIPQSKTKQAIAKKILDETGDIETAKFKITEYNKPSPDDGIFTSFAKKIAGQRQALESDPIATESIKQGFDEAVVASIKAASPKDRDKLLEMVNIMEQSKKNARYATINRPSDIVGESLARRVDHILELNNNAGKRISKVAKSELTGNKVDFDPAVNQFIDDLDEMGISIGQDLKPVFYGSDVEGLTGVENIISKVITRMTNTKTPDAYDLHRMKKYIDENVSYGKQVDGLTGKTESVLKKLRGNIDEILDNNFPAYNEVNTVYAETRNTLDQLKDSIGKKIDLQGLNTDKALGTEMRKIMSNYQNRINIMDSLNAIDGTIKKYPDKIPFSSQSKQLTPYRPGAEPKVNEVFDDDLIIQALFADELNKIFGTTARTSLQGETAKGFTQGARAFQGDTSNVILEAVSKGAEKLRGINQENAFKSIKELLKDEAN